MKPTTIFRQNRLAALTAALLCVPISASLAQDLTVRNSGGAQAMFMDTSPGYLYLGQAGTIASDVDLRIRDPFYTSGQDDALFFNASTSDLTLGSGTSTVAGDGGDIFLQSGNGTTTVNLAGSSATITAGASGNAGEVRVVDDTGTVTGTLDGLGGILILGATGEHGNLAVRDSANVDMLNFDASSASLIVGNNGDDGDLFIDDTAGAAAFIVDGATGNVTNKITGNGTVKAWAQINATGTVASCWRCNTSTTETRKIGTGIYEVDFTPLSTDISARPRSATLDVHIASSTSGQIGLADRSGDTSSVWVGTQAAGGTAFADRPFVLVIY